MEDREGALPGFVKELAGCSAECVPTFRQGRWNGATLDLPCQYSCHKSFTCKRHFLARQAPTTRHFSGIDARSSHWCSLTAQARPLRSIQIRGRFWSPSDPGRSKNEAPRTSRELLHCETASDVASSSCSCSWTLCSPPSAHRLLSCICLASCCRTTCCLPCDTRRCRY